MKTTIRIFSLFLAVAVFIGFNSCNDDDGDGVPDILDKMSADIDGQTWNSAFRISTYTETEGGTSFFTITGTNGASAETGEYLNLIIRGNEVKSYNLSVTLVGGEFECTANYKPSASGNEVYTGTQGTISLTKVDLENKKISGTFNFTVAKTGEPSVTKQISNGEFNDLTYQIVNAK